MKSWKTTLGGAIIALGSFLQTLEDPAWISVVGATLIGVGGLLVGGTARDNGVSSEEAGVK